MSQNEVKWAESLAARLRLLHVSVAERPAVERRKILREEVEQGLSKVPEARRQEYYRALRERMPRAPRREGAGAPQTEPVSNENSGGIPETWEAVCKWIATQLDESDEELRALYAAKVLEAARMSRHLPLLLDWLAHIWQDLDDGKRRALTTRMNSLGIVLGQGGEGLSPESTAELKRILGVHDNEVLTLDSAQTGKLLTMLVYFFAEMEKMVWQSWVDLAGRGVGARRRDFRTNTKAFLAGSPESLNEALIFHRILFQAFLSSVSKAGIRFGNELIETLSPDAVEAASSGGVFGDRNRWAEYQERFRKYETPAHVGERIRAAHAEHISEVLSLNQR